MDRASFTSPRTGGAVATSSGAGSLKSLRIAPSSTSCRSMIDLFVRPTTTTGVRALVRTIVALVFHSVYPGSGQFDPRGLTPRGQSDPIPPCHACSHIVAHGEIEDLGVLRTLSSIGDALPPHIETMTTVNVRALTGRRIR
jgi:hypothetical protein